MLKERRQGWIWKISSGIGETVFLARETDLSQVHSGTTVALDNVAEGTSRLPGTEEERLPCALKPGENSLDLLPERRQKEPLRSAAKDYCNESCD